MWGGVGVQDRVSLCSPDCPGTLSVHQAGLELKKSACLCLPSAGITGMHHHCPAALFFQVFFFFFNLQSMLWTTIATPSPSLHFLTHPLAGQIQGTTQGYLLWAPEPGLAVGAPPRGHSGLNPNTQAPPSYPRLWNSAQVISLPTSSCSGRLSIARGPVQSTTWATGPSTCYRLHRLLLEPPTCSLGPRRPSTTGRAPIKAADTAANVKKKKNHEGWNFNFFLMLVHYFVCLFVCLSMTRIKTGHTGREGQIKLVLWSLHTFRFIFN
jgi:hypothetical protein